MYGKALCNCSGDGRSVVNCTVPQTTQESKEINIGGEDIRDLMQLLSMGGGGGGGGARVDVDSEGNIVWRKAAAESSYGGGVGRIGRIDEEKPCCFSEGDVFTKFRYSNTAISVNYKPRLLN
ncbi:hypothetical protein SASPL_155729 [Salvia splendens]|uniref:Uncharacterized protein n=1 Tax=Salvia splendens TaxID=180675 RepID=A0A8X8YYR0_SALSN|nr:hypothetical protein SASPL_155729 [Salvia splendens]